MTDFSEIHVHWNFHGLSSLVSDTLSKTPYHFRREILTVATSRKRPSLINDRGHFLDDGLRSFKCFYRLVSDHLKKQFDLCTRCICYTTKRIRCTFRDNMKLHISYLRTCMRNSLSKCIVLGPLQDIDLLWFDYRKRSLARKRPLNNLCIWGGRLRKVWVYFSFAPLDPKRRPHYLR